MCTILGIVGLDPRTLATIYSDAEFNEFLESSSKIIQRALSDGYDYLKDYSMNCGDEDGMYAVCNPKGFVSQTVIRLTPAFKFRDDREGKRVKRSCEFYEEKLLKNRSVTDLDWSTKVSSILLSEPSLRLSRRTALTLTWLFPIHRTLN